MPGQGLHVSSMNDGATGKLAAQLCGLYSGEERWANDSDDLFADMEEPEEDEAAIDND